MNFIVNPFNGQLIPDTSNPLDKGYFLTEAALNTALPVGEAGWKANVEETDSIWIWDVDTNAWMDSGKKTAIGETSDTAYRGDRGKIAYDHSQVDHAALSLPVTALGTIGVQTIDADIANRWTITPSGTITFADSNFTTLQKASIAITNGGLQTINLPSSWIPIGAGSFVFQNNNVDVLNLVYDGTQITVEHVPAVPTTSYVGLYSTGDRTSEIAFTTDTTLTNAMLNGSLGNSTLDSTPFLNDFMKFEFPQAIYVDEFKWHHEVQGGRTEGTWTLSGSNNDIDWTELQTDIVFNAGAASPSSHSIGTTGYFKYYRMICTVTQVLGNGWWYEMEFKTNS
jgi:hypothetical protein